jgi:hypothetical protein
MILRWFPKPFLQKHLYGNPFCIQVKNGHDLFDEPETIAFIPTSLLVDVFAKEFAAVKDMHNLDIEAAPMDDADLSPPRAENKGCSSSSNNNVKLKKSKEDGESRSGSGSAKSMQQQKGNNVDDNQEQEVKKGDIM